jgi:hypothetical protein
MAGWSRGKTRGPSSPRQIGQAGQALFVETFALCLVRSTLAIDAGLLLAFAIYVWTIST